MKLGEGVGCLLSTGFLCVTGAGIRFIAWSVSEFGNNFDRNFVSYDFGGNFCGVWGLILGIFYSV